MNITKWLKDEDGNVFKVEWQVIPTTEDDTRGYTIEGVKGKWLTVVSTFVEDAGKNILSMNPFTNPSLDKYTEISEEEVKEIQAQKEKEEETKRAEEDRARTIAYLKDLIGSIKTGIEKRTIILEAVKAGKLYDGDLKLMEALHNFNEEEITSDKKDLEDYENRLARLQGEDGE